jgi:glutathione S-transferase
MKLIGTRTSPFVRRVRIVAQVVGAPLELCDSSTDEGRAALERASPIWKVPVLDTGDAGVVLDSHDIIDYLIERFGAGALALPAAEDRLHAQNRIHVIDGALDAAINVLYLRREGIVPDAAPYLKKQMDRVASALSWLEADLAARPVPERGGAFGLFEIALVTTLDWMRFRDMYPVERHPGLTGLASRFEGLDVFATTRPEG